MLQFTGGTESVTGVPDETISQLLLSGGASVSLSSSAAVTLTLAGGPGTDLSIPSGTTLALTATAQPNAITLALGSGANADIGGVVNVSGTVAITNATNHRLEAPDASAIQFASGSQCNILSGFQGNRFA